MILSPDRPVVRTIDGEASSRRGGGGGGIRTLGPAIEMPNLYSPGNNKPLTMQHTAITATQLCAVVTAAHNSTPLTIDGH